MCFNTRGATLARKMTNSCLLTDSFSIKIFSMVPVFLHKFDILIPSMFSGVVLYVTLCTLSYTNCLRVHSLMCDYKQTWEIAAIKHLRRVAAAEPPGNHFCSMHQPNPLNSKCSHRHQ